MSEHYPKPYERVFIKLSGESLSSAITVKNHPEQHSVPQSNQANKELKSEFKGDLFNAERIKKTVQLIRNTHQSGLEVVIMSGGGNIARGSDISYLNLSKPAADSIGMLATEINSLVLYEYLKQENLATKVMSSLNCEGVFESFSYIKAREYLAAGNILILAGGSGKPLFTTDTAAAVLAVECGCEAIFKLTKVDGIYTKDPSEAGAEFLKTITISEAIKQQLKVMDQTAFTLCQENKLPIHICNMNNQMAVVENSQAQFSGSLVLPDNNQ